MNNSEARQRWAALLSAGEAISYRHEHENQQLYLFRPRGLAADDLRPCVFFIHGGGWGGVPEQFAAQCVHLAQLGLVAITIHFRRPSPSPVDSLADTLAAWRWVKANAAACNVDPARIVASGGSAGGHLALAMVTIPGCDHADDDLDIPIDPAALVLFNPVIDLVAGWEDGQQKCRNAGLDPAEFSPAHKLKPGLPPTLVMSGSDDPLITPEQLTAFKQRMDEHGNSCRVIIYPGCEHGFFNYGRNNNVYFDQTLAELRSFLRELGYLQTDRYQRPADLAE